MTNITIIGTGNMGQAIAGLVTKGGNTAQILGETDTDEAVTDDIVVLAVNYTALSDFVATRGASLAGKVVVDITNPDDFATFDSLVVPAGSSAAAGLNAIDAGTLHLARELEAIGFAQISLAVGEKVSWIGGFGVAA